MVGNRAEILPGDFTRNPDFSLPSERLRRAMATATGAASFHLLDASRIANAVAGQTIAANMIMLGYAYQIGGLPLSAESVERAIELNGEAAAMNKMAFRWGRYAAMDATAVEKLVAPDAAKDDFRRSQTLDEMVERRVAFLTDYQD